MRRRKVSKMTAYKEIKKKFRQDLKISFVCDFAIRYEYETPVLEQSRILISIISHVLITSF